MSQIDRQAAIETLRANYPDACYEQLREAVDAAIEALKAQDVAGDTISRQAAIDAVKERYYKYDRFAKIEELVWSIEKLPSAQPEYEPVTAEDFAKTMSENTIYSFITWHNKALELMEGQGFVICKKMM